MSIMTKKAILEKTLFGVTKEKVLPPDPEIWAQFLEKREKRKTELIKELTKFVYPTSQIIYGEITVEEYITSIADFLANEMFDRRMPTETLPLFAELAVLRKQK